MTPLKNKLITRCSILACTLTCIITSLVLPGYTYGQVNAGLEKALALNFPKESQTDEDGRWVYQPETANIKKINKPLVKARIPAYEFYQVKLLNLLGYHRNQGTCVVLFDSVNAKVLLAEPMWYGGTSKALLALFIGQKFDSKDSLLNFLTELNELMQIGSIYKFKLTAYTNDSITYDLGYSAGSSTTTGGNGISSTVRNNEDGVWRKIKIDIKDLAIIQYTATNPVTGEPEIVNKDTKVKKP
jgi:hypothetical protein